MVCKWENFGGSGASACNHIGHLLILPAFGYRYYDAQVKCPVMAANGTVQSSSVGTPMYTDYYYEQANGMDTKNCYGFIQVRQ